MTDDAISEAERLAQGCEEQIPLQREKMEAARQVVTIFAGEHVQGQTIGPDQNEVAFRSECATNFWRIAQLLRVFRTATQDAGRLEKQRDTWHAVVRDICEEWSEANDAVCDPACSSYGHEGTCKATNIAQYLKSLRQELAASTADAARWRREADTARAALGHVHERVAKAVARITQVAEANKGRQQMGQRQRTAEVLDGIAAALATATR
jgi:hypothetical protein